MSIMSDAFIASQYELAANQVLMGYYRQAKLRGIIKKVWSTITLQPNNLLNVDTITQKKTIRSCRYVGSQTVYIKQIRGSEGRCQDFDQDFNPLKSHNQNRWISVASAWERGSYLPAVDLIKVGDVFFVRDGHHRISVASFMGADFVDARVTEWVLDD
jgi:hypothetical protein